MLGTRANNNRTDKYKIIGQSITVIIGQSITLLINLHQFNETGLQFKVETLQKE